MKNLCVFLDGTLNNPEGRKPSTNVYKLFLLTSDVNDNGLQQIKFYTSGVGTYSSLDKPWTVVIGKGVQVNVRLAYQFVGANFSDGDRILIFGFSRGAFSARHLAGMIAKIGILKGQQLIHTRAAYDYYRYLTSGRTPPVPQFNIRPYPVHFLGLWDTVSTTRFL